MKRMIGRLLKTAIVAPLGAMTLFLSADNAQAQQMVCGKRDAIIDQLKGKYGETARVMGFSQGAGVVEVYANDESGSWTILVTNPSGTSCLMAAGEAFETVDLPLGDAPA